MQWFPCGPDVEVADFVALNENAELEKLCRNKWPLGVVVEVKKSIVCSARVEIHGRVRAKVQCCGGIWPGHILDGVDEKGRMRAAARVGANYPRGICLERGAEHDTIWVLLN